MCVAITVIRVTQWWWLCCKEEINESKSRSVNLTYRSLSPALVSCASSEDHHPLEVDWCLLHWVHFVTNRLPCCSQKTWHICPEKSIFRILSWGCHSSDESQVFSFLVAVVMCVPCSNSNRFQTQLGSNWCTPIVWHCDHSCILLINNSKLIKINQKGKREEREERNLLYASSSWA